MQAIQSNPNDANQYVRILGLPELVRIIARYFDHKTCAAFRLTCRATNDAFINALDVKYEECIGAYGKQRICMDGYQTQITVVPHDGRTRYTKWADRQLVVAPDRFLLSCWSMLSRNITICGAHHGLWKYNPCLHAGAIVWPMSVLYPHLKTPAMDVFFNFAEIHTISRWMFRNAPLRISFETDEEVEMFETLSIAQQTAILTYARRPGRTDRQNTYMRRISQEYYKNILALRGEVSDDSQEENSDDPQDPTPNFDEAYLFAALLEYDVNANSESPNQVLTMTLEPRFEPSHAKDFATAVNALEPRRAHTFRNRIREDFPLYDITWNMGVNPKSPVRIGLHLAYYLFTSDEVDLDELRWWAEFLPSHIAQKDWRDDPSPSLSLCAWLIQLCAKNNDDSPQAREILFNLVRELDGDEFDDFVYWSGYTKMLALSVQDFDRLVSIKRWNIVVFVRVAGHIAYDAMCAFDRGAENYTIPDISWFRERFPAERYTPITSDKTTTYPTNMISILCYMLRKASGEKCTAGHPTIFERSSLEEGDFDEPQPQLEPLVRQIYLWCRKHPQAAQREWFRLWCPFVSTIILFLLRFHPEFAGTMDDRSLYEHAVLAETTGFIPDLTEKECESGYVSWLEKHMPAGPELDIVISNAHMTATRRLSRPVVD